MEQRAIGRLGRKVSVVGLGTWQLGADRGQVDESGALASRGAAVDNGMTLLDTGDVNGDGRGERLIGRYLAGRGTNGSLVARKMGRRGGQRPEHYPLDNVRAWTDRSRSNL